MQSSLSTLLLFAAFYGATATDVDCVGEWGNGCVDDKQHGPYTDTYGLSSTDTGKTGVDALAQCDYGTQGCPDCNTCAEHCDTIFIYYGVHNPCKLTCGVCTPLTGRTCEPGVCGNITYTITTPAEGEGAACPAADGETQACDIGDSGCVATDCVGAWTECLASVEACADKTYSITANAMAGGAECPYDHWEAGTTKWFDQQQPTDSKAACTHGDGKCVVADCVGEWSACEKTCEKKTYTVTTPRSGGGAECASADGAKAACVGGDGACVAVDCAGSWSACEAECADKTYTVAKAALGGGAECTDDDGDTAACVDADGACVVADCDGSWSVCEAGCADKTYTVTTVCEPYPASEDDGATEACVAGDGDCAVLSAASASTSSFFGTVAVACVGATLL